MAANQMNPITEDDIANWLANNPEFFERHAELLAAVQLTSPHGNRAVSLQERQAEMLREKIKSLEHRIMDMVRHGNENMVITDRILRWSKSMLLVQSTRALPAMLVGELQAQFMVPQVALKVWDVDPRYAGEPFAQGASEDAKTFASSLTTPYCGMATGLEAVRWLDDPATALSIALVPLRPPACICAIQRRMCAFWTWSRPTSARRAFSDSFCKSSAYSSTVRAASRFSTRTCSR